MDLQHAGPAVNVSVDCAMRSGLNLGAEYCLNQCRIPPTGTITIQTYQQAKTFTATRQADTG